MHVNFVVRACVFMCVLVSPKTDQTVSALYPTGGGTQLWGQGDPYPCRVSN